MALCNSERCTRLTRTSRGLLHQLGQLLVHHGVPKGITACRLPAASAAAAGGKPLHALHVVITTLGSSSDLLQQPGAVGEPALGELVSCVVQPVPIGELQGVLGERLDSLATQLRNASEPARQTTHGNQWLMTSPMSCNSVLLLLKNAHTHKGLAAGSNTADLTPLLKAAAPQVQPDSFSRALVADVTHDEIKVCFLHMFSYH